LATQNPIEQEGTYPLPEAQMDRFLLKVKIGYPNKQEVQEIIRRQLSNQVPVIEKVVTREALLRAREVLHEVYMDDKIQQYIVNLVFATREPAETGLKNLSPLIGYGASPRAGIALSQAARALAFIRGRGYVSPEEVRAVCADVMRHRIGLTYEAEAEGIGREEVIRQVVQAVEVP
jgi:MoxR-like ATPase